jgi:hypothetical protein
MRPAWSLLSCRDSLHTYFLHTVLLATAGAWWQCAVTLEGRKHDDDWILLDFIELRLMANLLLIKINRGRWLFPRLY